MGIGIRSLTGYLINYSFVIRPGGRLRLGEGQLVKGLCPGRQKSLVRAENDFRLRRRLATVG